MSGTAIYLDHAATTPLHPQSVAAMQRWLGDETVGNPASGHLPGRAASEAVETARSQVADLIGAQPRDVVWTSGATEANNLALKGALGFNAAEKGHLLTPRTEHKSVVDTARWLERQGHRVSWLPVQSDGLVDLAALGGLLAASRQPVTLLSVMWVNNEIGVIQDIAKIAELARSHGVTLHVDATQAAGRVPIDLDSVPVDLLSLSAHKLGGPQGIGALFVRGNPRARIAAQMHGGGHERGLRSGTLPVHQCVGFGAACEAVAAERDAEQVRQSGLQERLWQGLRHLPEVCPNGHPEQRVAGILNISFGRIDGESLLADVTYGEDSLAVSSGSACTSATREASYVLRALGRSDAMAQASLRFSLGRTTTEADIDTAVRKVIASVERLRNMSPLWREAGQAVAARAVA